jgi:hypothetical protein
MKEQFGRCHLPGNPMLYCSVGSAQVPGWVVAVRETIKPDEKRDQFYVTISAWMIQHPVMVADIFVPSPLLKFTPDEGRSYHEQLKIMNRLHPRDSVSARMFNMFMSNEFAKDVSSTEDFRYVNSAYLTYLVCNKTTLGGILYPSQKAEGAAYNMALKPATVDSSLSFFSAFRVLAVRKSDTEYAFEPVSVMTCTNGNGEIEWRHKPYRLL